MNPVVFIAQRDMPAALGFIPLCDGPAMTSQEKQRMLELCQQIMVEEDHGRMIRLVQELNDIFDAKEMRLRQPIGKASINSPIGQGN